MLDKIWNAIKLFICVLIGCPIIFIILNSIFGHNIFSIILFFIAGWFWINYCFDYYCPKPDNYETFNDFCDRLIKKSEEKKDKEEDNEVDFKDLK
jgi:hypothetical protein